MVPREPLRTVEQLQDLLIESPDFTEFLLELTTTSASFLGGHTPLALCDHVRAVRSPGHCCQQLNGSATAR
jgi:hypothetical protein